MSHHVREARTRVLENYLDAIASQDVDACTVLFATDAVVHFMMQTFAGREQIQRWHEERFANGLEADAANQVRHAGAEARLDLIVRSNRLRIWRIDHIRARGLFRFDDQNQIVEARFNLARPDFAGSQG